MTVSGKASVLGALFGPLKKRLVELVSFSVFINILALVVPVFVLQVYDRVVYHAGLTTLQGLVIGAALAVVFDYLLRQARSRLVQRIATRIDVAVGRILIRKLTALPLRVLESQTAAQWQALTRDAEAVRDTLAGPPLVLAIDLPFVVLFVTVIAIIAPPLALVLAALIPLFLLTSITSAWLIGKSTKEERDGALERDAVLVDMVAGRTTVKALGLGAPLARRWAEKHAVNIDQAVRRGSYVDGSSNIAVSLGLISTVAMTSIGAIAIIDGALTMGALVATNMLVNRVIGPLNQIIGTWRQIVRFRQSLSRLSQLFAQGDEDARPVLERPRPQGGLALDGVSFSYIQGSRPALKEVSLRFGPGGLHGVVGPNGGGKTTLLKLCQGLYRPESGIVSLDGIDMAQLTRAELARWVGYVPQDPFLFSGTIRDNLALVREGLEDADLLKAAELAGAAEFINALPDGYATDLGENGRAFSAGQRQRIALARAFAGDPPVLLLDEPSAHLDRKAEEALAESLGRLAEDHTVVVVSHSQALLRNARTLTVIDGGMIVAHGPAARVLEDVFGIRQPVPAAADRQGRKVTTPRPAVARPPVRKRAQPRPASGMGEAPADPVIAAVKAGQAGDD